MQLLKLELGRGLEASLFASVFTKCMKKKPKNGKLKLFPSKSDAGGLKNHCFD